MANMIKGKMQPPKAKAAIQDYGMVELITAGLMGLVLVALILAALIAPSQAHVQPYAPTTIQVMVTKLPQDFSARLDGAGLALMSFERFMHLGLEVIEVKDYSAGSDIDAFAQLTAAFPEIAFERIDELDIQPMSAR